MKQPYSNEPIVQFNPFEAFLDSGVLEGALNDAMHLYAARIAAYRSHFYERKAYMAFIVLDPVQPLQTPIHQRVMLRGQLGDRTVMHISKVDAMLHGDITPDLEGSSAVVVVDGFHMFACGPPWALARNIAQYFLADLSFLVTEALTDSDVIHDFPCWVDRPAPHPLQLPALPRHCLN